jgi:hypothetical protein
MDMMTSKSLKINKNAFTLVISSMNVLYSKILAIANQMISGALENRKTNLKEYYVLCARLFLIDTFLWGAMFSKEDEIFYQDIKTSEVWKEILKRHTEIKIDKDVKLMKSHEKFTVGVCTGLAGISKGSTYD